MKLNVKLVSDQETFIVSISDGRTLVDIYNELTDLQNGTFVILGDQILQKPVIEWIKKI